jgi:hypothetical protein
MDGSGTLLRTMGSPNVSKTIAFIKTPFKSGH